VSDEGREVGRDGRVADPFERIANPPEGVISVRKERFADVAGIETPDPLTVVFKLKI